MSHISNDGSEEEYDIVIVLSEEDTRVLESPRCIETNFSDSNLCKSQDTQEEIPVVKLENVVYNDFYVDNCIKETDKKQSEEEDNIVCDETKSYEELENMKKQRIKIISCIPALLIFMLVFSYYTDFIFQIILAFVWKICCWFIWCILLTIPTLFFIWKTFLAPIEKKDKEDNVKVGHYDYVFLLEQIIDEIKKIRDELVSSKNESDTKIWNVWCEFSDFTFTTISFVVTCVKVKLEYFKKYNDTKKYASEWITYFKGFFKKSQ